MHPTLDPVDAVTTTTTGEDDLTTRVLLVDDSEDMRLLCRLALEVDDGFEICGEAANGAAAIDAVTLDRPDVVVLDIEMPVMDGFEALPHLLELHPHVPVIMLSAGATPHRRAKAMRLGAHALVGKDPGMRELQRTLQEILPTSAAAPVTSRGGTPR